MLLPVAGVVEVFGLDVELSAEPFNEGFGPFCLQVSGQGCFFIGYDTDSDSLAGSIPGSARYD